MMWPVIFSLISGLLICLLKLLKRPAPVWHMKGMASHGPGSRKLGAFEKVLASWSQHGYAQAVALVFLCSKKPITESVMRQAFSALPKRHPLFRMKFCRENGVFTYMKEMDDFKLDLKVCNHNDWKRVVEEELNDVIDSEKGPLWRVKYIPNCSYHDGNPQYPHQAAYVTTQNHAITDGISGFKCTNELFTLFNDILNGKEVASQPLPMLPPIDAYLDSTQKHSLIDNVKINVLDFAYSISPIRKLFELKDERKIILYTKKFGDEMNRNAKAPLKTCIIPFELTSEQTSKLKASCKMHKVSVTSAIQTACCIAYCTLADGGKMKEVHKLNVTVPYSLLDTNIPANLAEAHGVFSTSTEIENKICPDLNFWDNAREANARMKAGLTTRRKEKALERNRFLNKNGKESDKKFIGERTEDLLVSNLGELHFPTRGDPNNIDLSGWYTFSANPNTGRVFNNIMATINGKVFWTVSYSPRATSTTLAQSFVDLTLETLFSAVNNV